MKINKNNKAAYWDTVQIQGGDAHTTFIGSGHWIDRGRGKKYLLTCAHNMVAIN